MRLDLKVLLLFSPRLKDQADHLRAGLIAAGFPSVATGSCEGAGEVLTLLAVKKPDLVVPLSERKDGSLQGLLEFCGFVHAGLSQTSCVLTNQSAYAGALLAERGVIFKPGWARPCCHLAVLAGSQTRWGALLADGPSPDPLRDEKIKALALAVPETLRLTGWALLDFAEGPQGPVLVGVDAWPDLAPEGFFRRSLQGAGLAFAEAVRGYLSVALENHRRETALRVDFRDRV